MHRVPLFLDEEERFLFGLTMRQCLLLFIGAGMSSLLFAQSVDWIVDPTLALVCGLALALLTFLTACVVAFCKIGGRGLEEWGLVLLVYSLQPRVSLWHFDVAQQEEK